MNPAGHQDGSVLPNGTLAQRVDTVCGRQIVMELPYWQTVQEGRGDAAFYYDTIGQRAGIWRPGQSPIEYDDGLPIREYDESFLIKIILHHGQYKTPRQWSQIPPECGHHGDCGSIPGIVCRIRAMFKETQDRRGKHLMVAIEHLFIRTKKHPYKIGYNVHMPTRLILPAGTIRTMP